jgi:hypothetical protein
MIYRKMKIDEASALMDLLEKHGIDYDVWNMAGVLMNETDKVELGLSREDWNEIGR